MAYALFPDFMRKMMAIAIMAPVPKLRLFGAVMAASGFCLILLML
ncbi:MAG: DUF2065 family protein [Alphaproteobacteria bacterium]|nr:DUF2065 family protein [Alphaproteobacteria bacterium]MBU0859547.1 DUF2065 family protein [Alphaproteobacteria bacterium]